MIQLVTVNNPRLAQAFVDYMASQNIEMKMTGDGNGNFSLWLVRDEEFEEVEQELKYFLRHPEDKKYSAASWELTGHQRPSFNYDSGYPGFFAIIRRKAGVFTLAVMVLCIFVFFLQNFGLRQIIFSSLHFPDSHAEGWQLWRWVSHAFLHFSAMHITFNLLWWWFFGGDIEKRLGVVKLGGLFLVSAAVSGLVQFWFEGANFGGLSGVIYALVGYVWMMGWKKPEAGLTIHQPLLGFMLIWLVIGYVQPFIPIANSAHLAGLVVGVLMGLNEARHRS
ncbi:Rhomboid protease GlpG [Vibrio aerogenes CECT 7868]|uniref:Rhomboid protease GlpG n=1 Tax=Vibrio aerogenes CECT 7868 TaxID=1216006 RepID=A0A1M6BMI4_9VIBR|nr:rhomboid family intramembrane serine protease GlpG [Vibrio aerogenes]SHI49758.1 Rhomboid protease GlpG [Vibrio aerogenes CECT 7868]